MSKFEIEVELLAVVVVDAPDENAARTTAYKNLEGKLKVAAKALGADEVKVLDVVGSEPLNTDDDAFYRPPRFQKECAT